MVYFIRNMVKSPSKMIKKTSIIFCIYFSFFVPLIHAAKQSVEVPTPILISQEKASIIASKEAKMGPAYVQQEARLVYDSHQNPWYTVDFNRTDAASNQTLIGKRLVIDALSGQIAKDKAVLKEMDAFISMEEATKTGVELQGLGLEYKFENANFLFDQSSNSFFYQAYYSKFDSNTGQSVDTKEMDTVMIYDSHQRPWYRVNSFRNDPANQKSYWEKISILDPVDGSSCKDLAVLKEFKAAPGDIPDGIDPNTKEFITPSTLPSIPIPKKWLSVILAALALLIAAGIFWRKKFRNFKMLDLVFGGATVLQLVLAIYFISADRFTAVFLLTSSFGTLTAWISTKAFVGNQASISSEELVVTSPKKLPNFSNIGGMEKVKEDLKNTVGLILAQGKLANQYGIQFNGVLLSGPPGVGKSFIARATAGQYGLNFLSVKMSDLLGIYKGSSAKNIDAVFNTALKHAPCLLFFDEFEGIASERGVVSPDLEDTRVVNQLLRSLEDIREKPGKVIVFAATNEKDKLDEAIIRPGRFDKHILIPLPDEKARLSILQTCLMKKPVSASVDFSHLVGKTDGMSAADIRSVVDQAMIREFGESVGKEALRINLSNDELVKAFENFRDKQKPSIKKISWQDLILQEGVIAELKRFVKIIEFPEWTQKLGIEPPKGILLYGPPGTGKTTVAKVVANEANASFFVVTPADVYSKWLGESEHNIKKIFSEARQYKPSIIFIDEIDSLMNKRGQAADNWADKIASLILQEIDGIMGSSNVFLIGATNMPDAVDSALLRGGRLSMQIEIPLPGKPEREKLFDLFLKNSQKNGPIQVDVLAETTEGLSGADIKEICNRAILDSFAQADKNFKGLTQKDLHHALEIYKKSSKVYQTPDHLINQSVEEIATKFKPTVVLIVNKNKEGKEKSFGSGFFVSAKGLIATNYHVVQDASALEITLYNGKKYSVKKIKGLNKKEDLALLEIETEPLSCVVLADSKQVTTGEKIVAIGNPKGLTFTVSDGIVSARRIFEEVEVIQITAPISPGSSGGPIFNAKGEVIGVAKSCYVDGQNLNFAVPSDHLKTLIRSQSEIPYASLTGTGPSTGQT